MSNAQCPMSGSRKVIATPSAWSSGEVDVSGCNVPVLKHRDALEANDMVAHTYRYAECGGISLEQVHGSEWMAKRSWNSIFTKSMTRSLATLQRSALPATRRTLKAVTPTVALVTPAARGRTPVKAPRTPAAAQAGQWLPRVAIGPSGARRYRLYRPAGIRPGEQVPLLVMLHGSGQEAKAFADSTRMNRIAAREGFLVLYPEQERLANAQGCWNWFDTRSGRAWGEVALIMAAIDQVCTLYPADRERVAVAGLSAGASMAALLVTRHATRFRALAMHSGVPPGSAHATLSALGAMRGRRPAEALPAAPMTPAVDLPPLLVIHGRRDAVVAPGNGDTAARQFKS